MELTLNSVSVLFAVVLLLIVFGAWSQAVQHKAAMQPISNSSSKRCLVAPICMQQPRPAALFQGRVALDRDQASTTHAPSSKHCTPTCKQLA
jgi:hypothetical protein